MKHRARIQIIHQILSVLEEGPESGVGKSQILYTTALSSTTLKTYLAVLVDNGLVEIKPPTKEQAFLRPAIKRYVVSTRKSAIFLSLYDQSRNEDLIWWETSSAQDTQQDITTTQTHTYQTAKTEPQDGEGQKSTRQAYNLFGKSRTPSC